ncbi:MAG TPA: transcriptional regulator [Rhizobacter sp.]|nr:transcriptional regulator [Rhizobacter sp.]
MHPSAEKFPVGNGVAREAVVRSTASLGELIKRQRKQLALKQLDVAGLGNTGNRFIVELERGKPTVQLQKVLQVLDLLGLELVVRPKSVQGL